MTMMDPLSPDVEVKDVLVLILHSFTQFLDIINFQMLIEMEWMKVNNMVCV